MICDIRDFHLHDYCVVDGKIGYKEQDQINFNITYGYKTTFAYYKLLGQGSSNSVLDSHKVLGLNLG